MYSLFPELKVRVGNFMSLYLEKEGFSPLVGRIYTLLLFSSEPLSLQSIADELSVSKAAVSVQIRAMEQQKLCRKVPVQNDRKAYYYITEDSGLHAVRAFTGKITSVRQMADAVLTSMAEPSSGEPLEGEDYTAAQQRFKEISMICELFMTHMGNLTEEWQRKKQLL